MGGHVARMGERRGLYRFLVERLERDCLEDLGIDGGMILKWISKALDGEAWTVGLGQGRDRWQALVNAVMNFMFHKMCGVSCLAEDVLASQEGHCSMALVGRSGSQ